MEISKVELESTDKHFELYVYKDPGTGIIKGMMGIGSEMLLFFEQKGKDKGCPE